MGRFIFITFGWLVVFLSLSGTGAALNCASGWSAYDQHCYKAFDEPKSWADAEKFCTEQAKGGHLVSFHSSEEADFVVKLAFQTLESEIVWMGLSKVWNGLMGFEAVSLPETMSFGAVTTLGIGQSGLKLSWNATGGGPMVPSLTTKPGMKEPIVSYSR